LESLGWGIAQIKTIQKALAMVSDKGITFSVFAITIADLL